MLTNICHALAAKLFDQDHRKKERKKEREKKTKDKTMCTEIFLNKKLYKIKNETWKTRG